MVDVIDNCIHICILYIVYAKSHYCVNNTDWEAAAGDVLNSWLRRKWRQRRLNETSVKVNAPNLLERLAAATVVEPTPVGGLLWKFHSVELRFLPRPSSAMSSGHLMNGEGSNHCTPDLVKKIIRRGKYNSSMTHNRL